ELGLNHRLPCLCADANITLRHALQMSRKRAHPRIDRGVHDVAVRYFEPLLAEPPNEPELAIAEGESRVVAIVPGIFGAKHRANGCVFEPAEELELRDDHVVLELELPLVADVLQLATAAGREQGATRFDAVRRRLHDFLDVDRDP